MQTRQVTTSPSAPKEVTTLKKLFQSFYNPQGSAPGTLQIPADAKPPQIVNHFCGVNLLFLAQRLVQKHFSVEIV